MVKKKMILGIGLGLLIIISGFVIWGYTGPEPMDDALDALDSDENISITTDNWIEFQLKNINSTKGIIIYPGGRIDPRSYAPIARAMALAGFLVIVAPMPLNLAIFQPNIASKIISEHPEIELWAIGGHSLGGVMAAQFAQNNPTLVNALFFWASYPAANISSLEINVLSISGSLDGLSTPEKIEESKSNLPSDTTYVVIEGGNHAQFGWYGDQKGDNVATISREQQQALIIVAMVQYLF